MQLIQHDTHILQIDDFLTFDDCTKFIGFGESEGFKSADVDTGAGRAHMNHIRNNQRVDWYCTDTALAWWRKLSHLPLPTFNQRSAIGVSPFFRFYKYSPGEKFSMHKDGRQKLGEHESLFTFLVYLNDGYQGGMTSFRYHNFTIEPQAGRALMFEHHQWHKGDMLVSGTKYVMRTDVIYSN